MTELNNNQLLSRITRRRGDELFAWLTAAGVAVSLLLVGGLLVLIMLKGLGQFWPVDILEVRLADGRDVIGQVMNREIIPHSATSERLAGKARIRLRVGNRDVMGSDFRWVNVDEIVSEAAPPELMLVERREWGMLLGRLNSLYEGDTMVAEGQTAWTSLGPLIEQATQLHRQIERLEQDTMGEINSRLEWARMERHALTLDGLVTAEEAPMDRRLQQTVARLEDDYRNVAGVLEGLYREAARHEMAVALSNGQVIRIPLSNVIQAIRPNDMTLPAKLGHYFQSLWLFLSGEPREANTEGGILPAIFGTVMMVLIMTIAVMPCIFASMRSKALSSNWSA